MWGDAKFLGESEKKTQKTKQKGELRVQVFVE